MLNVLNVDRTDEWSTIEKRHVSALEVYIEKHQHFVTLNILNNEYQDPASQYPSKQDVRDGPKTIRSPPLRSWGDVFCRVSAFECNTQSSQLVKQLVRLVLQNRSTFGIPYYCVKKSALYNSNNLTIIISIKYL